MDDTAVSPNNGQFCILQICFSNNIVLKGVKDRAPDYSFSKWSIDKVCCLNVFKL
jgi:hypothetical protein